MRYAVDPRQKDLFDLADMMFSPMAIRHMRNDWPGLFRTQMLHLMPVGKIAENFHPSLGCPTQELYSMAGAIFLKEFFNLTIEETVRRYLTDGAWHFSLNIVPTTASISHAMYCSGFLGIGDVLDFDENRSDRQRDRRSQDDGHKV